MCFLLVSLTELEKITVGYEQDFVSQKQIKSSNHVVAPVAQLQLNLVIHKVMSLFRYLLSPNWCCKG